MPEMNSKEFEKQVEEVDKLINKGGFLEADMKCKAIAFDLVVGISFSKRDGFFSLVVAMKKMKPDQRERFIAILIRMVKIDLFYQDYERAKDHLMAILYINLSLLDSDPVLNHDKINRSDKSEETAVAALLLYVAERKSILALNEIENEMEKIKSIFS